MVSTLSVIIKVPAELACRRRCKLQRHRTGSRGFALQYRLQLIIRWRIASRRMARDWCRRSHFPFSIVMGSGTTYFLVLITRPRFVTFTVFVLLPFTSTEPDREIRLDAELARYRCWRGHRNHAEAARIAGWIELRGAGEIRAQRIYSRAVRRHLAVSIALRIGGAVAAGSREAEVHLLARQRDRWLLSNVGQVRGKRDCLIHLA